MSVKYILEEKIKGLWLDFYCPGGDESRSIQYNLWGPFPSEDSAKQYGELLKKSHQKELSDNRKDYFDILGANNITIEDKTTGEKCIPEHIDFDYCVMPLKSPN